MEYRTIQDLSNTILHNLHRLPADIDLVVGIPRSGLLAANILALHRNLPLTDVEGFIAGRLLGAGRRLNGPRNTLEERPVRRAIVLDDSVSSGFEMKRARQRITAMGPPCAISYAAVYGPSRQHPEVDLVFEVCQLPRVFEWNMLNHISLVCACVDIDGVLCCDPSMADNDDAERYLQFLYNAQPFLIPHREIGWLVTSRLEKYREQTVEWLARHHVRYRELRMLDLPSKAERIAARAHATFKADVYRRCDASLFIESSYRQATEIANRAGKPVLSVEHNTMIWPGDRFLIKAALANGLLNAHWLFLKAVRRLLLRVAMYTPPLHELGDTCPVDRTRTFFERKDASALIHDFTPECEEADLSIGVRQESIGTFAGRRFSPCVELQGTTRKTT